MGNINHQFILSILVISIGYIFKRFGIIKESDGDGVSRIIFNITLPSLIINTFNTMKLDTSLIFITLTSLLFGAFMSIIGILLFRNEDRKLRGTLSMAVPGLNIGLFAYPIVEAIWGRKGLKYFGMLDMGNSIVMFVFCYIIASYFGSENKNIKPWYITRKLIRSIPLMTYIITLSINLSGKHYPPFIINITAILSKANAPLSLLLLGICLNFSIDRRHIRNIVKILSARYLIGLAIGIVLFVFTPFDELFRHTLLIGLILPIGMAIIPYAVEFGYDKNLIGTLCNITILLSFALIWGIVAFL